VSTIRSRYYRPKPKGVTFTRGVCAVEGCQEERLGTSGLCLRTHHAQFLKIVRAEMPLDPDTPLHCVCDRSQPSNEGMMLRLFGTVECRRCGRAIFNSDGKQVHEVGAP
jgi:hypothetical protein